MENKFTSPGKYSSPIIAESGEEKLERLIKWYNSLDGRAITPNFLREVDEVREQIYTLAHRLKKEISLKIYEGIGLK